MRIKNLTCEANPLNVICISALFFLSLLVNLVSYFITTIENISLFGYIKWYISMIQMMFQTKSDWGLYAFFTVLPIVALTTLAVVVVRWRKEIQKLSADTELKYVDFSDNSIFFKFNNSEKDFSCTFEQIDSINLEICTRQAYNRVSWRSVLSELHINFTIKDKTYTLSVVNAKLYQIIKFLTTKTKKFSYKISGSGADIMPYLQNNIDSIINTGVLQKHKNLQNFYIILAVILLTIGCILGALGVFSLIFEYKMWALAILPIIFFGVPICLFIMYTNKQID